MHKSENTLLIWILSWAGILLTLLYSPIFSPDLYKNKKYYDENQGVNYDRMFINKGLQNPNAIKGKVESVKGGICSLSTVKNAPKRKDLAQTQNEELLLSVETVKGHKGYNYQSSYVGAIYNPKTAMVYVKSNKNPVSGSNSASGDSNGSYSGNAAGGGGNSFSSGSGSNRGSQNNTISQNPGATTSGVDLTLFSDSTKLLANNNQSQKASLYIDPGSGDPLGTPIPIPEGWGFLFLLAALYGLYILIKTKKIKLFVSKIN